MASAGPASAQVPTTTTPQVLVPGTTAPPTPSTTAGPTTTSAPDEADEGGLLDLDANEKVWIIVVALVGVAVLLLVLTVLYWRHTKPDRPKEDRQAARAERKEQKRRRKADKEILVVDEVAEADAAPRDPASGPMDLDEILGSPDPARSVFGSPDEPGEPSR
jgi:hypothetical protein